MSVNVSLVLMFMLLCILFNVVQSLNILGIFPFQGKSHSFVFKPFLEELTNRGHNVTVISCFPRNQPLKNYQDISLAGKIKIIENEFVIERSYWSIIEMSLFIVNSGTENCRIMLEDENVQNLWKFKIKFDIIIVEQFNSDCSLGLAHKLGAPVVGMTAHVPMPWLYKRFGIPYNPSYVPFAFLEGGTKPTLYQRVERILFDAYFNFLFKIMCQRVDQNTLTQYFGDMPPLEELARNIKFLMIYTHFILTGSNLYPANVIEINGYHVPKTKPLPEDLQKFIEESEYGVIYISFGSVLRASITSRDKIDSILTALSKLPQRVIWKWEEKTLPGDPKNIYVSSWLPQNDILAHPKVLAFYSHCGLVGTTEAIHHGVPMVAMPVFGDQPANAAFIENSGLGVQIQISELNSELLLEKFRAVFDPNFRSHVKILSKAWRDRPVSAMDSAIYWTEYAARYSNFTFRAAAADVPLYQYLCLDVFAILILIFLTFILSLKGLISLIVLKSTKLKRE